MNHRTLLGAVLLLAGLVLPAHTSTAQTPLLMAAASTGISITSTAVTLDNAATPAPQAYGDYARFGLLDAAPQAIPAARRVRVTWDAAIPAAAAVRVDLRIAANGRWSDWTPQVAAGAVVTFDRTGQQVQARLVLLANAAAPSVTSLLLEPLPLSAEDATLRTFDDQVAPTYHIRATRMGLVGDRTANGHIIAPNDWFVSLPSFRSLSSRGGGEYQVRLTYKDRSVVVPVWEVGPWNVHDDYWNVEREKFADLPVGWPEDHAAYFDGYNGGWAEKGRVRFPTAADVGDGAWVALGIPFNDEQEELDITFLWQGNDPGAAPTVQPVEPVAAEPPAPLPEGSVQVDSSENGFARSDAPWYEFGCGINGQTFWTYSTPSAEKATNSAHWDAALGDQLYTVSVFVPFCVNGKQDTTSARYVVYHADGASEVVINQAEHAGSWVDLGRYHFVGGGSVGLSDLTDDSMRSVWFDAVRWVPAP